MKLRKNQIIATEGALPYRTKDGSIKYLLKDWTDLKKFIGKKIKVVDGHPKEGVIGTNTKIYKELEIRQCNLGKRALCVDYEENDDIPKRKGYSIGYVYIPEDRSGEVNGVEFSGVQRITYLDHLALTDNPRNPDTLVTDSEFGVLHGDVKESNGNVNKSIIAFDSIRDFEKNPDQGRVKAMTDEKELLTKISELQSKIAVMETQKSASDAYSEEVKALEIKNQELEKEVQIKQDAIKHFEKLEEDRKQLEMKATVEFLKEHKVNIDELPDNDIHFLEGIRWSIENAESEPDTAVTSTATDTARVTKVDGVEVVVDSTNNYVYDKKTDSFVRRDN